MKKRQSKLRCRRRKNRPARKTRRPLVEALEDRLLLVSDWQNGCNVLDTSNDGQVAPLDALIPINRLNEVGAGTLPLPRPAGSPFHDTTGNGTLEPLDVLLIINALNGATSESIFTFSGGLENDTAAGGATNGDNITSDARLSGRMSSLLGFESLQARVDGGQPIDILHTCGSFSFDPGLATDGKDDGQHSVSFIGRDPSGGSETFDVTLTLDSVGPSLALSLSSEGDTGLPGDRATSSPSVTLTGQTEPGQTVSLDGRSGTVVADSAGNFQLVDVSLAPGTNPLAARTSDVAGNESVVVESLTLTPCDFDDDWTVGAVHEDELPVAGTPIPVIDPHDPTLPLASGGGGQVQRVTAILNDDFVTDVVTVSRASDERSAGFERLDEIRHRRTRRPGAGSRRGCRRSARSGSGGCPGRRPPRDTPCRPALRYFRPPGPATPLTAMTARLSYPARAATGHRRDHRLAHRSVRLDDRGRNVQHLLLRLVRIRNGAAVEPCRTARHHGHCLGDPAASAGLGDDEAQSRHFESGAETFGEGRDLTHRSLFCTSNSPPATHSHQSTQAVRADLVTQIVQRSHAQLGAGNSPLPRLSDDETAAGEGDRGVEPHRGEPGQHREGVRRSSSGITHSLTPGIPHLGASQTMKRRRTRATAT